MNRAPADSPWFFRLAAWSLGFVLVVVAASAYIRLGTGARDCERGLRCASSSVSYRPEAPGIRVARAVQRVSASLAALAIVALAALALRRSRRSPGTLAPALGALAVATGLTAIGLAAGISPPPDAALANLLGGVALAALLAWLLGRLRPARGACDRGTRRSALAALALLILQSAFGAWLSTRPAPPALTIALAHAAFGLGVAAAAIVLGLRLFDSGLRGLGLGLAALSLLALAAGLSVLVLDAPLPSGVAHHFLAALLAATLAYVASRSLAFAAR